MPNNEELARYVAAMQDQQAVEEKSKGEGYMLPPPPKPGEFIYCRICGRKMLPADFSDDPKIRKREFKWQIHYPCEQRQFEQCDMQTPGLLAERKQNGLRLGRPIKRQ